MQHLLEINGKKQKTEKLFSVYFQQMLHVAIFFLLFVTGNYIGISFWQDGAGNRHNDGDTLLLSSSLIFTSISSKSSKSSELVTNEDNGIFSVSRLPWSVMVDNGDNDAVLFSTQFF